MKKPTNQVRRQSGTKPSTRQAEITAQETVTVIFYSVDDDKELFRTDFPKAIYAAIERASKKLRISMDEFFNLAIMEMLGIDGIKPSPASVVGGAR